MNCHMKFKIIWACIGISAGLLAGATFAAQYKNYVAATIAFFSSVCATYLLYIHIAYHKRYFHTWPQQKISFVIIINSILATLGLIGMTISLVVAGIRHQTLTHDGLQDTNLWIVAVWCWMTFKWTMMSAYYTRQYAKKVEIQSVIQRFEALLAAAAQKAKEPIIELPSSDNETEDDKKLVKEDEEEKEHSDTKEDHHAKHLAEEDEDVKSALPTDLKVEDDSESVDVALTANTE